MRISMPGEGGPRSMNAMHPPAGSSSPGLTMQSRLDARLALSTRQLDAGE